MDGSTGGVEPPVVPPAPEADAVTVRGSEVTVRLARVPQFAGPPGGDAAVILIAVQVIVVRTATGDYRAFSTVCPHAGCGVSIVRPPQLICPCHSSVFDFSGARLEGPAPTGLQRLPVQLDAGAQVLRIDRAGG